MKGGKVSEDGGWRRGRAMFLLSPSFPYFPSLFSRKVSEFDPAENAAEPLIRFQDAKVVDRLSSGQVEEDKGENDLFIRPALDLHMKMGRDAFTRIED